MEDVDADGGDDPWAAQLLKSTRSRGHSGCDNRPYVIFPSPPT